MVGLDVRGGGACAGVWVYFFSSVLVVLFLRVC